MLPMETSHIVWKQQTDNQLQNIKSKFSLFTPVCYYVNQSVKTDLSCLVKNWLKNRLKNTASIKSGNKFRFRINFRELKFCTTAPDQREQ